MPSESDVSASSARREPETAYEQLTIDTPEQIALEFALAGVGSRFLALLVDSLIQLTVGIVLVFFAFMAAIQIPRMLGTGPISTRSGTAGLWVVAAIILAGFCLYYGYFVVFEIIWRGQSPGKRLIGLRVIATSGRPATCCRRASAARAAGALRA